ncbi:MAG: deoxyribonuclease V [Chloroflexi bacterium]|nr:deoxyribonuclease V [Chloroflexota bacterium]
MKPVLSHPWELSPKEAVALQLQLRERFQQENGFHELHLVGGVDVGVKRGLARAVVVVMSLPELKEIERSVAERSIAFPYVPGLLSFREGPAILDALTALEHTPDVLLFDGQGYAHPRRMGIATHIGILLDHPTIGCAKSRLIGTYKEPGRERGSYSLLYDEDEIIGAVLRTRTNVKPIYVSIGHKVRLESAIDIVLRCGAGYRLPEPTRLADQVASRRA